MSMSEVKYLSDFLLRAEAYMHDDTYKTKYHSSSYYYYSVCDGSVCVIKFLNLTQSARRFLGDS